MEKLPHRPTSLSEHPLYCCSHLRWNFVLQRPQHLMSRFAKHQQVIFIEEPLFRDRGRETLAFTAREPNLTVVTPHLNKSDRDPNRTLSIMLHDALIKESPLPILWYYTPLAMAWSARWPRALTVYDCMDELSLFAGADHRLQGYESQLFAAADLVFTGGRSLYEAKRHRHPSVYPFPSSIDRAHFARALIPSREPADQAAIKGKKIGFFGVIDERLDCALLAELAELRKDLQFIILGPVVKISPKDLPHAHNLHYLGQKSYALLPDYLAHWDAAIMPFAMNDATRFISPTKTPEFLAGGRPVVSTPIRDVVTPYGESGVVRIARDAAGFAKELDAAIRQRTDDQWQDAVNRLLNSNSWDRVWSEMHSLMSERYAENRRAERSTNSVAAHANHGSKTMREPQLSIAGAYKTRSARHGSASQTYVEQHRSAVVDPDTQSS